MADNPAPPAPQGGQPPAPAPPPPEGGHDAPVTITQAELNRLVNAAVSNHVKRATEPLQATINELRATRETPPPPAQGEPAKGDPEMIKLRERLDQMEKRASAAEAARKTVEQNALRDSTRRSVMAELESKGIKGSRARALVHDLEATGALKYDESGKAVFTVKRKRAGDVAPQEFAFEDLREGVEDWSKLPEAQEWLPAPAPQSRPTPNTRPVTAAQLGRELTEAEIMANAKANLNARLEQMRRSR